MKRGEIISRALASEEYLTGDKVSLRLITLEDCTPTYESWLGDPEVNKYLETRWRPQTIKSIRNFVSVMLDDPHSYLFAIEENSSKVHVGNLKIGPINLYHAFADVSYFIGEKRCWGKGYAAEAIELAASFAFGRLGLHRLQAGRYAGNVASRKAMKKAGFNLEGVLRGKLLNADGLREDHHLFGLLKRDWESRLRKG